MRDIADTLNGVSLYLTPGKRFPIGSRLKTVLELQLDELSRWRMTCKTVKPQKPTIRLILTLFYDDMNDGDSWVMMK